MITLGNKRERGSYISCLIGMVVKGREKMPLTCIFPHRKKGEKEAKGAKQIHKDREQRKTD